MNKIEEFLQNYKSKATIQTYRSLIRKYFDTIDKNPDTYFKGKQDYEGDIKQFWKSINDKPPKTIAGSLAAVKAFLAEYNVELKQKFWKKLRGRTKGKRAWTDENVPTVEQLQKILTHANTLQRSIVFCLVSSGMRIGELLSLKLTDIDLNVTPTRINVSGEFTKSGERRTCYISAEATTAVDQWLKVRDAYLKTACQRVKALEDYLGRPKMKTTNDDRLFPVGDETVRQMWNRLLDKAGFGDVDERTKIHKMHLHTLRKFYRSKMPKGIGLDMTEALLGHSGYLTDEYRRYTDEEIAEAYLKGMHLVSVFTTTSDLSGVHEAMDQLKIENEGLQKQLNDLRMEMLEVKMKQVQELQTDSKNK